MKITVRVKPNARKNEVKQIDEKTFLVSVTAPPVEGKANEKMIEVLAEYFRKPKSYFTLIMGTTSRNKIMQSHLIEIQLFIASLFPISYIVIARRKDPAVNVYEQAQSQGSNP
jgi:uncharacterized protein (TIGR00251 family)